MRVLVVARGPTVAELLGKVLGPADDVRASSPGRLADALHSHPPDLLVIDESSLGSVAALTRCRDARRDHQSLPILYLSGKTAPEDEVLALDSGADSFLSLPCVPDLLLARLRSLLRRQAPHSEGTLSFGDLTFDAARREVRRNGREIRLTATEFALLGGFMRSPDVVLSRDELIEKVWGRDYAGNYGVLDVYVCYLRSKLEASGEPRLIQTARGAGFALRVAEVSGGERAVASRVPRRPRPVRVE